MRIIGGRAKGRRLHSPAKGAKFANQRIRPTSDRAREALFNIIGSEIDKATVLDLYAGTGALGLEAMSRGAELAVFVDHSNSAIQIISKNIDLCGFSDKALIIKRDLSKGLSFLAKEIRGSTFHVVFVDPPYRKELSCFMLKELSKSSLLVPQALVVIEENALAELPDEVENLILVDRRRYGETGFWLFRLN